MPFLHMKGLHSAVMWLTGRVMKAAQSPAFSTGASDFDFSRLLNLTRGRDFSGNGSGDWSSCAEDLKELAIMVDVIAYSYACSLRREMPARSKKPQ